MLSFAFIYLIVIFALISINATVVVQFSSNVANVLGSSSGTSTLDNDLAVWIDASQYNGPGSDTTDGITVTSWMNLVNSDCSFESYVVNGNDPSLQNNNSICGIYFDQTAATRFEQNMTSSQCQQSVLYNLTDGFTIIAVMSVDSLIGHPTTDYIFTAASDSSSANTSKIQLVAWPASISRTDTPSPQFSEQCIMGQYMSGISSQSINYTYYNYSDPQTLVAPATSYTNWSATPSQRLNTDQFATYSWWVNDASLFSSPVSRMSSGNQSIYQPLVNALSPEQNPAPKTYVNLGFPVGFPQLFLPVGFYIAELVVYNRALEPTEVSHLESYFKQRYSTQADPASLLSSLSDLNSLNQATSEVAALGSSKVLEVNCSYYGSTSNYEWPLYLNGSQLPSYNVSVKSLTGSPNASVVRYGSTITGIYLNSSLSQFLYFNHSSLMPLLGNLTSGVTITVLFKEKFQSRNGNVGFWGFGDDNICISYSYGILYANNTESAAYNMHELGQLNGYCNETIVESFSMMQPARNEPEILTLRLHAAKKQLLTVNGVVNSTNSYISTANQSSLALTLGYIFDKSIPGIGNTFDGYISYVVVHNTLLSDDLVAELQTNILADFNLTNRLIVNNFTRFVPATSAQNTVSLNKTALNAFHAYYNSSTIFYNFSGNSNVYIEKFNNTSSLLQNASNELISQFDIDSNTLFATFNGTGSFNVSFSVIYANNEIIPGSINIILMPQQVASTTTTLPTSTSVSYSATPTANSSYGTTDASISASSGLSTGTKIALSASFGFVGIAVIGISLVVLRKHYLSKRNTLSKRYSSKPSNQHSNAVENNAISSPILLKTVGNSPSAKCPDIRSPSLTEQPSERTSKSEFTDLSTVNPTANMQSLETFTDGSIQQFNTSPSTSIAKDSKTDKTNLSTKAKVALLEGFPVMSSSCQAEIPLAAPHEPLQSNLNNTPTLANYRGEWISGQDAPTKSPNVKSQKKRRISNLFARK